MAASEVDSTRIRVARHALAGFLLCVGLFTQHLVAAGYPLFTAEILWLLGFALLPLLILGLVGLLPAETSQPLLGVAVTVATLLVADPPPRYLLELSLLLPIGAACGLWLRDHFALIINVVLAVFIAAQLLSPRTAGVAEIERNGAAPVNAELPLVVHVILDEHIGVSGIPEDLPGGSELRTSLVSRYLERGFDVYSGAYSPYSGTVNAIAELMSLRGKFDFSREILLPEDGFRHRMARNDYFETLAGSGYTASIYQTYFFDFCNGTSLVIANCLTGRWDQFDVLHRSALTSFEKARFLLSSTIMSSVVAELVRRQLAARAPMWAEPGGVLAPTLSVSSLVGMETLDQLIEGLASARAGEFHFAHVLLPHFPYIYNEHCELMPLGDWRAAYTIDPSGIRNTAVAREAAYRAYFRQINCVTDRIVNLADVLRQRGLLDNSLLIVHGDHGSRISRTTPDSRHIEQLRDADLVDTYSTLFVVRHAGANEPGQLIHGPSTIRGLLAQSFGGELPPREPTVYLYPDLREVPYPAPDRE